MNFQMMQVLFNLNIQRSYDEGKQTLDPRLQEEPNQTDPQFPLQTVSEMDHQKQRQVRLQEDLNRFKEIQKNPQFLLKTLSEMEHQKKLQVEETAEMTKIFCYICGVLLRRSSMKAHLDAHIRVCKSKQDLKGTSFTGIATPFRRVLRTSASQVENGKKWYICKVCGKCLHSKPSSVEHFRIHTGEKPEKCRLCYRTFRQKSALRAHLKSRLRKY